MGIPLDDVSGQGVVNDANGQVAALAAGHRCGCLLQRGRKSLDDADGKIGLAISVQAFTPSIIIPGRVDIAANGIVNVFGDGDVFRVPLISSTRPIRSFSTTQA
jgi:hypothetical protein